ncbi:nucleotide-diphospho-sugar transferase, partial [Tribonema minus]
VVVLVTPEISPAERALFTQAGAIVTEVEKFTVPNPAWPAYNDVATKLHVWTLLQYSRIVYLDSDIVVCSQPDRILDACPVGSTFCAVLDQGQNGEREGFCNTGVFVVQPNMSVFQELNANKSAMADLRYADQDWLNQIYSNYTHLDDRFNEASALRFDNKMRQCRVGSTVFMHGKFWQLLQEFP